MTTDTQAAWISEQFNNDGQQFEDEQGNHIETICKETCVVRATRDDQTYRYEFADGSAIVIAGDGWDIGFRGHELPCWCWPSAHPEHADDCWAAER